MRKLIYTVIIIVIQHSTLSIQNSFAQAPISTPDNKGAGNSLSFDGSNDYVSFVDLDPLINFSVEGWILASGSGIRRIFDKDGGGGLDYWLVYLETNGTVNVHLRDNGSSTMILAGTKVVDDGKWHHISYVRNGTNSSLYIDGALDGTATYSGFTFQNSVPFVFATPSYSPNNHNQNYEGKIDEVRFWNRAISQTEIQNNMTKKLVGNETGLLGYWRMNEGAGNTVFDLTSNGNNGTRQ